MNPLGIQITGAPNQSSVFASWAAGSSGRAGIRTEVVAPTRVAPPRPRPGLLAAPRIRCEYKRSLNPARVVATNQVTDNNALERTRSTHLVAGPRRSMRCSAGVVGGAITAAPEA